MSISKSRIAGIMFFMLAFVVASSPASAAKFKVKDGPTIDVWGMFQYGFEQYNRKGGNSNRDGLEFDADRVRFGTKMKWGDWDGGLHFDAKDSRGGGVTTLDNFIRDAYIQYKFGGAAKLKLGQFKTPVGMGYTLSGSRLPLVKRTFTARLALDRSIGAMLSGRNVGGDKETGGFGYDVGIFNTADRSQAVAGIDSKQKGDDHSFAARLMYDYGKVLHVQAYYGQIENAGGIEKSENVLCEAADIGNAGLPQCAKVGQVKATNTVDDDTEDYEVMGAGMIYKNGPMHFRAEYIDGKDVRGRDGYDEQAWYLMAGYKFTDIVEGVVRYQDMECDNCGGAANVDEDINRLEVGLNFYLGPNDRNGRVQLNYVRVGGDEEDYSGRAAGDDRYDALLGQVQLYF